eukprot:scaffold86588_cov17-Tisochrysis_lutea.AAC.1
MHLAAHCSKRSRYAPAKPSACSLIWYSILEQLTRVLNAPHDLQASMTIVVVRSLGSAVVGASGVSEGPAAAASGFAAPFFA